MNAYPVNLVLAVAVATATVFLGFLPARALRSPVLAAEAMKAALAWALVAVASPNLLLQYFVLIGGFCLLAWRQFRRDEALNGKMWLSMASGLGISLGVMLILAVTPFAYPLGLPHLEQTLVLTSVYVGGAVIGMAYVASLLLRPETPVSGLMARRYVGILLALVLVRAGELAARILYPSIQTDAVRLGGLAVAVPAVPPHPITGGQVEGALFLVFLVLPLLAFSTWMLVRSGRTVAARYLLLALAVVAFAAEVLVRNLAL